MGKSDRKLPPGPNPRGDQMTEKDQRQLRETQRQEDHGRRPGEPEERDPSGTGRNEEEK